MKPFHPPRRNGVFPLAASAALLLLIGARGLAGEAPLSWTSTAGSTIEAGFVRLEGTLLVLSKKGKELRVPLDQLSPESRKQAETLAWGGPSSPQWLEKYATLLFHEAFEREETGNLAKDLGNGWESATADRVPHIKQADLDQGVLKITNAPEAGHAPHIHHDAGFQDGAALIRFRFPGLGKQEDLTLGFVDRECKTSHAGHLCYAFVKTQPPVLTLIDSKTGVMDLANRKRSQESVAQTGKTPPDLTALYQTKQVTVPWVAGQEWHEILLVIEGDEMRALLDGKPMASHRSEGFAHPVKRWFSILAGSTAWVDDVKVWKLK